MSVVNILTLARDADNTIDVSTAYYEMNTKAENLSEDVVTFVEAAVADVDAAVAETKESIEAKMDELTSMNPASLASGVMAPMGELGAGLCVCPSADLPEGMVGLPGHTDRNSANWGNYEFSDGSVECCIGKFYYKITGNDISILGAGDFPNTVAANIAGYALHRAFIDGGEEKSCVFVDKYMVSKNAKGTGYIASSLAGGLPISTAAGHNPIADLTACTGNYYYECITAAHARDGVDGAVNPDSIFFATTRFIESALAMQSMAHAQACTSTAYCAWWGASNNFPKGCNNNALRDVNDTTVLYESDGYSNCAKTGTGDPFAKTTHNGQACGVADLNGLMYEVNLGLTRPGLSASDTTQQDDASAFYVLKESVEARTLTAGWNGTDDAWGDATHLATLYDQITLSQISNDATMRYGNGSNQVLSGDTSGDGYKMAGLGIPKDSSAKSSGGTDLFGNDYFYEYHRANLCVRSCYNWSSATSAGPWACDLSYYRSNSYSAVGFRCACYPVSQRDSAAVA